MASNIIRRTPNGLRPSEGKLQTLFETLNIDPHRDNYKISGGAGIAVAHITKATGEILSVRARANGAFKQMTRFDPAVLSVEERRDLEKQLHEEKRTQSEIADMLGVSQSTVSQDLRKLRKR